MPIVINPRVPSPWVGLEAYWAVLASKVAHAALVQRPPAAVTEMPQAPAST